MGLLLAPLVALVGFVLFLACAGSGVWTLLSALLRRRRGERTPAVILAGAAAKLLAALLLAGVPWVGAWLAESSTGWVDTDHDGMLDGFVNGSYDWMDINGGAWAVAAFVLVAFVAVCLAVTLMLLRRPSNSEPPATQPIVADHAALPR